MAKLKSIAFAVGIMLLIGAVLCLYFSLRNLSSIRPASAYEDMGVHTFVPEEVYPVQRENHATGRQKRNHPTTTVYIVRYRSEEMCIRDRPCPASLSDFRLPPPNSDNRIARNYLTAARRIDEDVTGFFFSTGDIYEMCIRDSGNAGKPGRFVPRLRLCGQVHQTAHHL